ncbi:hypothetical protein LLEC1_00701 [Akanthomyces lecanii]|uniref:ABC transmembrane type-1 domain-containing protein n=1 Tax=Cordyceps confragosa TaxID=2714763 RepID=A0A179IJ49_CORDF|nr:hypothetical protein LLEC1_00701 [Akanthomyces lecanii]
MGDDGVFGPQLQGSFDFTLRFELIFFFIVPSIAWLAALPFYVYSSFKAPPLAHAGLLLWTKLAFALSLVAVQAAALAYFHHPYAQNRMSMALPTAAAALSFVSAIVITIFVCVGHLYHCSSPAFLGFFLTITLLPDVAAARSLSLRQRFEIIAALQIAATISLGREATAGSWSRSVFFWMNGILIIGFRRNLTKDDIGNIGFETEALYTEFARCWEKANKEPKFALLLSCIRAVPEFFLFVILPRFMSIGFNFAQPFLLQRVVSTVSEEHPNPRVVASLIGATALIYTGKSMCAAWYNSYRLNIRICVRGLLLAALYNQTVRLTTDELPKGCSAR